MNSLSDGEEGADEGAEGGRNSPLPAKRVRVSDINITRYEKSSVSDPELFLDPDFFVLDHDLDKS